MANLEKSVFIKIGLVFIFLIAMMEVLEYAS